MRQEASTTTNFLGYLASVFRECTPFLATRASLIFSTCSACTCPGEDHPGPDNSKGRGVPEIDIIEAELNKTSDTGQVASQSAQFAPFTHDYLYENSTTDEWTVYDPSTSRPNSYRCVSR